MIDPILMITVLDSELWLGFGGATDRKLGNLQDTLCFREHEQVVTSSSLLFFFTS